MLATRVSRLARPAAGALLAAAVFFTAAPDAPAQQGGWTGNFNLVLGLKQLDEDDWSPADEPGEIGLELDFRPVSRPVNLVVGLRGGSDEADAFDPFLGSFEAESRTSEPTFGVKKIWEPSGTPIRPFVGGGLLVANAEATVRAGGVESSRTTRRPGSGSAASTSPSPSTSTSVSTSGSLGPRSSWPASTSRPAATTSG